MNRGAYIQYDLSKLMDNSISLIIPNGVLNGDDITSFSITNNGVLKRIEIGGGCFGKVRVFELDGLSELESVVIGQKSFYWAPSFSLTGLIDGLD